MFFAAKGEKMKHIFLNLKRFDVPAKLGGVNRIATQENWAEHIISGIENELSSYKEELAEFTIFWPELHILEAAKRLKNQSHIRTGSQAVFCEDISQGGNFGALTTHRPAAAMLAAGCEYTIIGHCEERKYLEYVIREGGGNDIEAVSRILNREIAHAMERGLKVLYCIGEKSEEQENWQGVLGRQLEIGLEGADLEKLVIAYEPIWSIGPGKQPADKPYIEKIASFIKEKTGGVPVVYGGGLKQDNAAMLASIGEIDGGLIALTRFSGEIGYYPDEYLAIVRSYLEAVK